jgi:biotin carboxylase
VPVPRFWPVDASTTAAELRHLLADVPGRLVLKPRAQAASMGIRAFGSVAEVLDHAATDGFSDGYELEEFIDGTICHLDGVVRDGVIGFISVSRYLSTCLDWETKAFPIGSVTLDNPQTVTQAAAFAESVLTSLGLRDSSFHLEAFLTPSGEFVFLEIACRFGGGGVPGSLRLFAGFDIVRESVLASAGRPSEWTGAPTITAVAPGAAGFLMIPIPGEAPSRVRRIHGLDKCPDSVVFSAIPSIASELRAEGLYPTAGLFVFTGPSTASVEADIRTLASNYSVETTPCPVDSHHYSVQTCYT